MALIAAMASASMLSAISFSIGLNRLVVRPLDET
jgi:hypothetical protein